MKRYAYIFGRTPELSRQELLSLYPEAKPIGLHACLIHTDSDPPTDMAVLGGTVKIAELLADVPEINAETLLGILAGESRDGQITFGISSYDVRVPAGLLAELKKRLGARGIRARFVEARHEQALSSVVIDKQHVTDIVLVSADGTVHTGVTRAIQPFEDWNHRDYDRPAPDPKRGMLPPKVARMIVNIARLNSGAEHPMLLDPFCGVGTIPAEAALTGCNVTGADISEDAILRAKKNHEWLRANYPQTGPLFASYIVADATHISSVVAHRSIDAIVTEPFMGENLEPDARARQSSDDVKNTLKGLGKLYIGALREWTSVLKDGATVIMAMPAIVTQRGIMRVKTVVDRCESLGYTLLTEPIEYSRPQAVVRREFFLFRFSHP